MTANDKTVILTVLGAVAFWLYFTPSGKRFAQSLGTEAATMTEKIVSGVRGIRNNNPGNIRISGSPWQGKISPNTDGAFEQFDTMENGIRALAKTLLTYFKTHGLNTVQQIISRWAPGHENPTDAYIQAVAQRVGVDPSTPINVMNQSTLEALARAIINFENGAAGNLVTDMQIRRGVTSALSS